MAVISISEAMGRLSFRGQPFRPDWEILLQQEDSMELRPATELVGPVTNWAVRHRQLGRIEGVVIATPEGVPLWDQPRFSEGDDVEPGGVVVVPWFEAEGRPHVVLIREFRFVVKGPAGEDGAELWAVPRGYRPAGEDPRDAAARELKEELGQVALEIDEIGEVNANTTFFPLAVPVFAARIAPMQASTVPLDPHEPVSKVQAFPLRELIETPNTACGFTQAALFEFLGFALRRGLRVL